MLPSFLPYSSSASAFTSVRQGTKGPTQILRKKSSIAEKTATLKDAELSGQRGLSVFLRPWFVCCRLPPYGPEEEGFSEQDRNQDLGEHLLLYLAVPSWLS